jgi:aspartate 4-decarboxylase
LHSTGWRLGIIGVHHSNILDEKIAALPAVDKPALTERYKTLTPAPEELRFIDRLVADSRDVALNHTAGLSTPQQVQMTLFSLFALLDWDDAYQNRCREIVHERLAGLGRGLGIDFPDDPLRVAYYVYLDLAMWGRTTFGDDFVGYIADHYEPLDVVIELAKRSGTVLLNGSGFDGPPWSVRISLANLNAGACEVIGRDLKDIVALAVAEWKRSQGVEL